MDILQELESKYKPLYDNQYRLNHVFNTKCNPNLFCKSSNQSDTSIIKLDTYLYENFNKMDYEEKSRILIKVLSEQQIDSYLLKYEFFNYDHTPQTPKSLTLNQFKIISTKLLNRYQSIAGGFTIEDNNWTFHDKNSTKFNIKSNELLLENTVCECDMLDDETNQFIIRLNDIFKCLSTNLKIEFNIKQEKKLIRLLIWIVDKNIQNSVNGVNSDSDSDFDFMGL